MAVALALWSLELKAGEDNAEEITPPAEVRVTNIALGADLVDDKGRTTVKLVYIAVGDSDEEDDEEDEDEEDGKKEVKNPTETVLCTLVPGQIEQVNLNIVLPADRPVVFASTGKNTVYLTGNYIDQLLPDEPPSEDELISDADIYGESDDGEEEEAEEPPKPQSKKRALEDISDKKKSQKEQSKKQKAENGEAVAAKAQAEQEEKPKKAKGSEKGKEKEVKTAEQEQTLAGGVKIKDIKVGKGPKAKKGDVVAMRYVGKLTNGEQFDANTKGKPFQFELGAGDVIKGWDVGIVGMQAGGERLLTIPPSMGYGKRAQEGIPASSTLIFEVKLLSIKS